MTAPRLRESQADLAVARILDGAAKAFVELGVSRAGMAEIAAYAGCSRATLYRYFNNRHALHLGFVADRAARLVNGLRVELASVRDPARRLVEYTLRAVERVRSEPAMAAWFEPDVSGATARMSRGSEILDRFAGAFVAEIQGPDGDAESNRLGARFLVRIIVSLLSMPGESPAEERAMIERFVVPSILGSERNAARWDLGEVG